MMRSRSIRAGALLAGALLAAALAASCARNDGASGDANASGSGATAARDVPSWLDKGDNWQAGKEQLQAFGERFNNDSWAMFEHMRKAANGGTKLTWEDMAKPAYDWSGIWTRTVLPFQYDPDLPSSFESDHNPTPPASAKLTPAGLAVVQRKIEHIRKVGGEYDPLSDCRPPGVPRWFTEPFLRDFVVTPTMTYLINEMVNDIRRVYTDGRPHTPEDEAFPSANGDTIGFWDGDMLVAHTTYLQAGQYQRGVQPDTSEQTTVVERWRKVNDKLLEADVWVFDPVNLAQPWYTRQSYAKLDNEDHSLRIRYWDCLENQNNKVMHTEDGRSQFPDFTFVEDDAAVSQDPAVRKAQEERAARERAEAQAAGGR